MVALGAKLTLRVDFEVALLAVWPMVGPKLYVQACVEDPPPCPRHQWSVSNAVASLWMSGRVPLRAGQDPILEFSRAAA